jgi:hypothetical protein
VHRHGGHFFSANVNSDSRRAVVLSADAGHYRGADSVRNYSASVSFRLKPVPSVQLSLGPTYDVSEGNAQFVDRFTDPSATHFDNLRVVFAALRQRSFSFDTRVSATFTPTLTLEVFAQPFISSGEYDQFREFVAPRTTEKRNFDSTQLRSIRSAAGRDSVYILDPDRNAETANFSFDNPDFNVRSLRGNAVLRWEYRPGSTLFVVWQQQRAGSHPFGDFDLGRDVDGMFGVRADNIFLVKLSYWFGR